MEWEEKSHRDRVKLGKNIPRKRGEKEISYMGRRSKANLQDKGVQEKTKFKSPLNGNTPLFSFHGVF